MNYNPLFFVCYRNQLINNSVHRFLDFNINILDLLNFDYSFLYDWNLHDALHIPDYDLFLLHFNNLLYDFRHFDHFLDDSRHNHDFFDDFFYFDNFRNFDHFFYYSIDMYFNFLYSVHISWYLNYSLFDNLVGFRDFYCVIDDFFNFDNFRLIKDLGFS